MEPSITEMAKIANGLVTKVIRVIDTRDTEVALQIDHDDDQMDKLQKNLMSQMTSAEWSEGTETAINMTLLIRYYERFADHAVSIARRVYFLVTGEFAPQEED
jgi:phosphate transport system protein